MSKVSAKQCEWELNDDGPPDMKCDDDLVVPLVVAVVMSILAVGAFFEAAILDAINDWFNSQSTWLNKTNVDLLPGIAAAVLIIAFNVLGLLLHFVSYWIYLGLALVCAVMAAYICFRS